MKSEKNTISKSPETPVIHSMEYRVPSSVDARVLLHVRERRSAKNEGVPLLLVHGATIPSVLWDNPLAGWSWMDRLAADGFHVFAVDLRGYGRSSRPESFKRPATENPPYARAEDVCQDVMDVIAFIKSQTRVPQVDLLGGSWGSIICGKLIAENPAASVRKLVLYAPLYAEPDKRPVWLRAPEKAEGSSVEENPIGAYRWVSANELRLRWDAEIPVQDKTSWRPTGVLEALVQSCIEDESAADDDLVHFRVPNGTIMDLHDVFEGKPLYDSRAITIPTLLVRGSADPTSTHDDASRLFESLSSDVKRYTVVGNGAHFMIGENKINEVHSVITGFLTEPS